MKKTATLLLSLGLSLSAAACDVCGGAGMNTGFGYIPLQKRHIVGINYGYNSFHTNHPSSPDMMAMKSHDRFHSADLWLRYFVSKKIMTTINLPYRHNTIDFGDHTYKTKGIGDLSAQAYYSLWRKGSSNTRIQTLWLAGVGVKAPTGKYNIATDNVTVQNLQLGSGSWDALFGSNLSLRINKLGFNNEINYSRNGANSKDFKFGNRLNTKLISFMQLQQKKNTWVPQLGVNYMHFDKDLIWASRDIERLYSGKDQVTVIAGLDFYRKSFGIRMSGEAPLYQEISEGYVKFDYTIKLQLLYFIKPTTFKKKNNE